MLPNQPAVVYVHWWSPTPNHGDRSFWNRTVEPESGLLAQYYDLPTLSMRNVWFHKVCAPHSVATLMYELLRPWLDAHHICATCSGQPMSQGSLAAT